MAISSELLFVVVTGLHFFNRVIFYIKYFNTFICQNAYSVLPVLDLSKKDLT